MRSPVLIEPDWPAPANVRAVITTRQGGYSQAPFDSWNLGLHVGDDRATVLANRQLLVDETSLKQIAWIDQVHGAQSVRARDAIASVQPLQADSVWTDTPDLGCAVMTADCLPILLCNQQGTIVSAVHAGWRGLVCGVVLEAVRSANLAPGESLAWIGPGISQSAYQVDSSVLAAFLSSAAFSAVDSRDIAACFLPDEDTRYRCDLAALARLQLAAQGVRQIFGEGAYGDAQHSDFFSYRRDGKTGRFASLIWMI